MPEPTPEAWAQIRYDYEHTERPIDDICAEHGISSGTLRDRMRRWGWTRRRAPIPCEGPPPAPAPQIDTAAPPLPAGRAFDPAAPSPAPAPQIETAAPCPVAMPQVAAGAEASATAAPDDRAIVPRLQSAVARVLSAIEATVATLAAKSAHPREMERAARVLAALTRTLRELNGLLRQHGAAGAGPLASGEQDKDIETRRRELAEKLEAFIASHAGKPDGGALPAASEKPVAAPSPLEGEGDSRASAYSNG